MKTKQDLIEEIDSLTLDFGHDNWDGFGAKAITQESLTDSLFFLDNLPSRFVPEFLPEVLPDARGFVIFYWDFGIGKHISVTLKGVEIDWAFENGEFFQEEIVMNFWAMMKVFDKIKEFGLTTDKSEVG